MYSFRPEMHLQGWRPLAEAQKMMRFDASMVKTAPIPACDLESLFAVVEGISL